jgi:hypothetical protein
MEQSLKRGNAVVRTRTAEPDAPINRSSAGTEVVSRSPLSVRVEAVAQAVILAERHGVRAWLRVHDRDDFVLLGAEAVRTIQEVLQRLRAEYLDMPGLQLTSEQVQRLCAVERTLCQLVLDVLVNEKFLCVTSNGRYKRLRDRADQPQLHPAKATLKTDERVKKAS